MFSKLYEPINSSGDFVGGDDIQPGRAEEDGAGLHLNVHQQLLHQLVHQVHVAAAFRTIFSQICDKKEYSLIIIERILFYDHLLIKDYKN